MTENRYRPSSPPRRYADPRASTGMVFSTSFDGTNARYASQPRSAVDSFPVARHGSIYTTQPVRKTFLDDSHPGGSITRTEYSVRPRNNSNVSEQRRPMSTYVPRPSSPPRIRPTVISSARDDPRPHIAPLREERYLVPASGQPRHHNRHASATRADQDRLGPVRIPRQPEYHRGGGYNTNPYSSNIGPLKDEDFSYTTPKEQFLQESSRAPQRRESYSRRERPISTIGIVPEYRIPQGRRDLGPPPSSARILERIDRPDSYRPSNTRGTDSDTDRERGNDLPTRRHSTRAPVLHQYRDDRNGRSSPKDDRDARPVPRPRHDRYDDDERPPKHRHRDDRDREPFLPRDNDRPRERDRDRDRDRDREPDRDRDWDRDRDRVRDPEKNGKIPDERRKPRSRDASPEHSGIRKGVAAAAGLAAAGGIASLATKASHSPHDDSDSEDRKERKHRRRRHRDGPDPDELAGRVERDLTINGDRPSHDRRRADSKPDEALDNQEDHRERRRHHRKHRDKSGRGEESDTTEDSIEKNSRHRPHEKDREGELREPARPRREREASQEDERAPAEPPTQQRTMSPGEDEDSRPRRVQLVEPVEKKEEFKPKGILKKPRAVPFPEDPNPQREGVAPLKDAGKEGIPANARWTKISRALVNPEALEKSHERFEERDDYVIVLRVVTREEIMKFAEKTKEIREIREREWQAELEERQRRQKAENGYSDSSDDDDGPLSLPRIEPPPVNQPDFRAQFQQQQQPQPQPIAARVEHPIAAANTTQPIAAPPPPAGGFGPGAGVQNQQPPAPPLQQPNVPIPQIQVEPIAGNYSTNV